MPRHLANSPFAANNFIMDSVTYSFQLDERNEPELCQFAEILAASLRPGDLLALSGDLGAGKTTFARAVIRALTGNPAEEIPSPTFTLVQTYETPRMPVAHFDLYRLSDPEELMELGLEDLLKSGVCLVEWPEHGGDLMPSERMSISIGDAASGRQQFRDVYISGHGVFAERARRLERIVGLLHDSGWGGNKTSVAYLQGDASTRRYARVFRSASSTAAEIPVAQHTVAQHATAILMDWPRQPDGPPIRDGQPYSRIAHLAEDVRPFVAIARALRDAGLAAPEIFANDLDDGLLLIEDFGDRVYGRELADNADQAELWQAAIDVLVHLRSFPTDKPLPIGDGTAWTLSRYDAAAMKIEIELLADWLWPFATGVEMPAGLRAQFCELWRDTIASLQDMPSGWVLRDFHSPNLIWRPDRQGLARVGVIDFQDAMQGPQAYDVASLLHDARVDVPQDLEKQLLDNYCAAAAATGPAFDDENFRYAYAALCAQRNTKILGIFARLHERDGKPHYVAHMPRIWGYLARALQHPHLAALKSFYDAHVFTLQGRRKDNLRSP